MVEVLSAQSGPPSPSPVSLLAEASYVTDSQHSLRYEGIRRVYEPLRQELSTPVSLSDDEKPPEFPLPGISRLGLKHRDSGIKLDGFMLKTEITVSDSSAQP